jgi:hypothetical protein
MVQFLVYICVGRGMTHFNGWVGPHQLLPFEVLLTFWYLLHKMGKIGMVRAGCKTLEF